MSLDESKQPIVIKRVVKHGGHHGGAWKIAFADFATAMMAFFLLLWILGATTEEQRAAISEYFQNPSAFSGQSQAPSEMTGEGTGSKPSIIEFEGAIGMGNELAPTPLAEEQIDDSSHEQDAARLQRLADLLNRALDRSETFAPYKEQLLIDITPEGLRIQIVDKENRSMFGLGSSQLKPYTADILHELGALINQVPNRLSITGHTDAKPLAGFNYSNWELSTERANAARRALIEGGMQADKIGRVVGLASTAPFDRNQPNNPVNRRISIIVMTQEADEAIHQETGGIADLTGQTDPADIQPPSTSRPPDPS
ncbi:flagellar motor protein MotB [Thiorhodococcus mannitoliphagus]|uniref:Flagellar motor protein MotB n=1 Tax=Thiorhodococcus mannitoliphagus TaxID=329406 RepID=A0A6P1DQC5_9GAMM|nr:flagellar motor protein MotB [Thiorhodococcus mannitoliphagus]